MSTKRAKSKPWLLITKKTKKQMKDSLQFYQESNKYQTFDLIMLIIKVAFLTWTK